MTEELLRRLRCIFTKYPVQCTLYEYVRHPLTLRHTTLSRTTARCKAHEFLSPLLNKILVYESIPRIPFAKFLKYLWWRLRLRRHRSRPRAPFSLFPFSAFSARHISTYSSLLFHASAMHFTSEYVYVLHMWVGVCISLYANTQYT